MHAYNESYQGVQDKIGGKGAVIQGEHWWMKLPFHSVEHDDRMRKPPRTSLKGTQRRTLLAHVVFCSALA